MNYELLFTALGIVVSILVPMGAGFNWLYTQMKEVRDELKNDIKRVEDKLDNKESALRAEIKEKDEKLVEQKLELQRVAIQSKQHAKDTRTLQERFDALIAALKREMPKLEI